MRFDSQHILKDEKHVKQNILIIKSYVISAITLT